MLNQNTPEDVNNSFYKAFQGRSIQSMDKIWSHNENTVCIHSGRELVIGWTAIRASWIKIFEDTESLEIKIDILRSTQCRKVAVEICLEHVMATMHGKQNVFDSLATNVFEKSEERWLLTLRHQSAMSNFLSSYLFS